MSTKTNGSANVSSIASATPAQQEELVKASAAKPERPKVNRIQWIMKRFRNAVSELLGTTEIKDAKRQIRMMKITVNEREVSFSPESMFSLLGQEASKVLTPDLPVLLRSLASKATEEEKERVNQVCDLLLCAGYAVQFANLWNVPTVNGKVERANNTLLDYTAIQENLNSSISALESSLSNVQEAFTASAK